MARDFPRPALHAAIAALGLALSAPAIAAPVTDCPDRNKPFSIDTPLIDILHSPQAKAVVDQAVGNRLSQLPPTFAGTTPPTFAAILTVKEAGRFTGLKTEQLPAMDAALRKVPVTVQDRRLRCERYDNDRLAAVPPPGAPRILLFGKINGFKDVPSFNAADAALTAMAQRKGWSLTRTQSGGAMTAASLRNFDLIIWNNISGDVLTLSQRGAMRRWIERGGGFLGVHGSAGDFIYPWTWYRDSLIGARFIGHPNAPQFQDARVVIDDAAHPIARGLPADWTMNDEWYSFGTNPRSVGARVVATLDERTYKQVGTMGQNLAMGADHPIAWTNCIGKGRMFYSAIGHRPETYSHPHYVTMLESAVAWTADKRAEGCSKK